MTISPTGLKWEKRLPFDMIERDAYREQISDVILQPVTGAQTVTARI
jgi:hypothetical protein